jgi:hypothetical protein
MADKSKKDVQPARFWDIAQDAVLESSAILGIYLVVYVVKDKMPQTKAPKLKNVFFFFAIILALQIVLRLHSKGKEMVGSLTTNAIAIAGTQIGAALLV